MPQQATNGNVTIADPATIWRQKASQLAQWAMQRMAVKTDRYGKYTSSGVPFWSGTEYPEPVTDQVLIDHFEGRETCGLGVTSPDDQCLWIAWDMDNHVSEETTNQNLEFAQVLANRLTELGFCPIIEDSDGKGGIHVWVVFSQKVPAKLAHSFSQRAAHDYRSHGLETIECYPKSASVQHTEKQCGGWLRLPGKHHKRQHWSRLWGDGEWLSPNDSIALLLSVTGDDPQFIPATVTPSERPVSANPPAVGDSREIVSALYALDPSIDYESWLKVGQALHSADPSLLDEWDRWSQRSDKYKAGECASKWKSFSAGGGITINTLFKMAIDTGWRAPRKTADNRFVDLSCIVSTDCTAAGESTTTVTVSRVLPSFSGIDAADLASYASQEPDWLVTGVFSIDEPLLVGARSKCCKTLQLTDLAVAVATGTQWLGAFEVPKRRKVLFITGETNFRRAAKHIKKACEARGLSFPDVTGWLRVEAAKFPTLPDLGHQAGIAADVKEHGFELVICDPLYRGLSGVDSSRLNEIGPAIKRFQAACQPACLVLSHHVIKTAAREYGNPPSLEDMTGAGIAESCGQWWLVGRNSKYEWNWQHDLCVQFGGRDGQGGGRRVLFDESAWTCQVDGWHDYVTEADQEQQRRKDDARREADELKLQQARARILKACRNVKLPQSRSRIRDSSGQSGISFGSAFAEMTRDQTLVQRPYRDGARRIQPEGWLLREYAAEYDAEWTRSEITDDAGR